EVLDGEARESARIIHETAQHMTQLVRELLDFARRRPAQPARVSAHEVARHVQQLLLPMAKKKRVSLEIEEAPDVAFFADVFQIQQALTNLTVNAIQAVPAGGHVTLSSHTQMATPPAGNLEIEYLCLGVRDDGPGIKEEDQSKIF